MALINVDTNCDTEISSNDDSECSGSMFRVDTVFINYNNINPETEKEKLST